MIIDPGFIVAAWLVMTSGSLGYPVPFATMHACTQAIERIISSKGDDYRRWYVCIETGALSSVE